uniref:Bradykinin-related peptide Pnor-5 n=1 Tax=Pithecopus nordestinus TaxID=2034992 RepID=BRK5_PITNO|nr:RecName: Full=Bradykinin-related peptide Pnor-5 [Pithecopus nordestinus]
RPLSWLPK